MKLSTQIIAVLAAALCSKAVAEQQEVLEPEAEDLSEACPDYTEYAAEKQ